MRGVCFQGIGIVDFCEVPDPIIETPFDAIIQVEMAGLCGSDLHPFFGREVGLDQGTVMGHEFVGTVISVGSMVREFAVGDRVYSPFSTSCGTCYYCKKGITSRCARGEILGWRQGGSGLHGGQAERVRVPLADGTLVHVPPGLSPESALLLGDNFSTGYFCAEMANIDPDGFTVVVGCGTVGLLAIQAAKFLGAQRILALERVESRRKIAIQLGAIAMEPGSHAVEFVRAETSGRGADSVLELVGLPEAQRLAYEMLRPGGTMSVIGCHSSKTFAFSPSEAYDKNLIYKTGRCPARHYMGILTNRVLNEKWSIDGLITHRFDPTECRSAYDIFAHQKDACIKSVFVF